MVAPRKGTATPLGAVFSPEETKRAVARVAEAIADRQAELERLQGFVADNAALVSLVNRLPDELSHEVPFGGAAFFPGRLIHTNELLVLLGEGYYADRSAKQTTEILHRRGLELEAQVEAMKATIFDLEAEAKFFESTAAEASEGLVEIREEYDEDMESNSSKSASALSILLWHNCFFYLSASEASSSAGTMSDRDRELTRIMARLDELEMKEKEAGSTSEEEDADDDGDDEGAETSEDGEGNGESGNALSDDNEHHSSGFVASFSGSGGNDRSHGNIQLKSALKKPGGERLPKGVSHTPSAHTSHPIFPGQTSIINSEVWIPTKAISFQDDKHMVSSLKSPSLPLDPKYSAPGLKDSSDLARSHDRKIISSGRKVFFLQAFTGSIIEHDDDLSSIQPSVGNSSEKPGTCASSRPMSRFKMQKGGW
ncbi:uncharacterized protein LOC133928026 isoform X2 [Phragmites australis]|uniref:uncharacterized protein LOC133928026 isoform X2 n=1 Tax=Phragmites australis TaxID=29695 RepID=UPI002D7983D3|nr:uncharacterized protein LOC133928026 isoform X2 [Phragmites australis]